MIIATIATATIVRSTAPEEDLFERLRVDTDSTQLERVRTLHMNIYYGGVKALIGQLGKLLYKRLPEGVIHLLITFQFYFLNYKFYLLKFFDYIIYKIILTYK
jgi:hypothetical protein